MSPLDPSEMSPVELMEHIGELNDIMASCDFDTSNPKYQQAKGEQKKTAKLLAAWAEEIAA